jgi:hypothetical protein
MKLQIKKAELVPDKYGQHLKVSMVGLYDDNGKWIKWIKLNEAFIQTLLQVEIQINEDGTINKG